MWSRTCGTSSQQSADVDPCGFSHRLWTQDRGFHGVESRTWSVTVDMDRQLEAHGENERRSTLLAGTRLRLDQTDWVIQGCDQGDYYVWHRFMVLDGDHAGRCVEFSKYVPDGFLAWIPDGIAPD